LGWRLVGDVEEVGGEPTVEQGDLGAFGDAVGEVGGPRREAPREVERVEKVEVRGQSAGGEAGVGGEVGLVEFGGVPCGDESQEAVEVAEALEAAHVGCVAFR